MMPLKVCGVVALAAALMLSACGTISKVGSLSPFHGKDKAAERRAKGNRIPVISATDQVKVADALKGQDFYLPPPVVITSWPVPGGTLAQSVEHADAGSAFTVAWRKSVGTASSRRQHVTATPITADGRIYVMDGGTTVSAHDPATGATLWHTNIRPQSKFVRTGWGGGLAFADGKIFASSGLREVVELDAKTGVVGWRAFTDAPVHGAPSVSDGKVFAVDVNDELFAFDMATGVQAWTYQALTEPARMLAASSSAVSNDTLVTSFASGELVALRVANGTELWNASLSRASRTNALSEIRDIAGRPVIYKNDVFAVSHSNVFAAVDLRTGTTRWTLPLSATTTPWPSGDVVFVVDSDGQVICVSRDSGQIYWIRDLNPAGKKKKKPKNKTYWSSPILASNRLITVSSHGEAVAIDPKTGAVQRRLHLGAGVLVSPIATGNMIYLINDSAQLIAIR